MNHIVVMAGGVGSRFWPMSTQKRPKQFIDVLGCGKSLLQLTVDRFKGIVPDSNVWVVTNADYASIVKEQLPMVPKSNILLEPCRRNTAPCIAYVSWKIKKTDKNANIVVTPSDHIVLNTAEFQRIVNDSLNFVSESDAMVTLGITPNRPETGYGYIQADLQESTSRYKELYRVDSFHEKPDIATANKYVSQKDYFWNAGIFVWNVETIINAFRIYQPTMARIFEDLMPVFNTPQEQEEVNKIFPDCENTSIDYAIMEKADDIYVHPANCGWSDLGTWGSLLQESQKDLYGNAMIGADIKLYDCHNCVVHTTEEKQVVVQGLDGYIVAEKDDTLLICKLSEEQRIKEMH
ncbi:MAG: mannose-1-phosphate guanylyltransferase [Prevotellaceae bacterium]|nr:mannose-1-phosphate guanylyltransferase [Prevotellaceae bacterium]